MKFTAIETPSALFERENHRLPMGGTDDDILTDLDTAFAQLFDPRGQPESLSREFAAGQANEGNAVNEGKELFETILIEYIPTIKFCCYEIFKGNRDPMMLASFTAIIAPLMQASGKLQCHSLTEIFESFQKAVEKLRKEEVLHYRVLYPFRKHFECLVEAISPSIKEKYFNDYSFTQYMNPVLSEIISIKGIGTRKLQRICSAGLISAYDIEKAAEEEIDQLTGIGPRLAHAVKMAAYRTKQKQMAEKIRLIKESCGHIIRELKEAKIKQEERILKETEHEVKSLRYWLQNHSQPSA